MLILFSVAVFLSAALLFLVEPMFARMILPRLGGAPAVWNTCVVFYQALLFGGYLYAHLSASRLRVRSQVVLHLLLLLAGLALMPIAVRVAWAPRPDAAPILAVFQLLLVCVSLPFFVLSGTGPLLQRWFGGLQHPASVNPYFLYAASNVGSLLALAAYPLLLEPALRLHTQSVVWTWAYVALIAVVGTCGVFVFGAAPGTPHIAPGTFEGPSTQHPALGTSNLAADWDLRLRWLCLAAVPSTLMLSVTTFISVDVAAVPLLWMVPLSLYLLTFILAFAERQILPAWLVARLFPGACVIVVALVLAQNAFPIVTTVAWHLVAFFIIALACHQQLASARPSNERLTEFYLWLSAGGVVGGLFNALIAPNIFVTAMEYPLAAIAACLLLPSAAIVAATPLRRALVGLSALGPALLLALMWLMLLRVGWRLPDRVSVHYLAVFLLPLLACYALQKRPLLMGVALASLLVEGSFVRFDNRIPLYVERTFFGIHRVMFTGRERVLMSGTTNHGAQSVDPALKCEPLTYYSRGGPVGQVFDSFKNQPSKTRFGVVGLGTGSIAAYAAPGQTWTFFEINAAVERIARNTNYFTYLRDCAPEATVVISDARLAIEGVPDGSYDALFVDAFSSDAIPVHLITTEALELYKRKLAPGGVIALHISNRYLALTPVVAAIARATSMNALVQSHVPTVEQEAISNEITASRWAVLAPGPADLEALRVTGRWESLADLQGPIWTDDYSNLFEVFIWRRRT